MSLDGLAAPSRGLTSQFFAHASLSMLPLHLGPTSGRPLNILCLGAHSDDLEIGCAGAIMEILKRYSQASISWVVLSGVHERKKEATRSATALLRAAAKKNIVLGRFTDGRFPAEFHELKVFFEEIKRLVRPDLILTHRLEDRHQDHRITAELTWQTWRDHLILEYEIPKYEGDLGQPNLYIPLSSAMAARKVRHLLRHFGTQRNRVWFREETFDAMMRLRGMECRAASGLAEAFHVRKAVL
jgi:LmbE family N-acetylglucosaminyl deacetylase